MGLNERMARPRLAALDEGVADLLCVHVCVCVCVWGGGGGGGVFFFAILIIISYQQSGRAVMHVQICT